MLNLNGISWISYTKRTYLYGYTTRKNKPNGDTNDSLYYVSIYRYLPVATIYCVLIWAQSVGIYIIDEYSCNC
jgi:hypothetical protein